MTARYKRRPKGEEYVPITMRYTPKTYNAIRKYAYEKNMSIGMANEELVIKGLQKSGDSKNM